jgi:hypothetical protein
MWYHWLAIVLGVYWIGMNIYSLIKPRPNETSTGVKVWKGMFIAIGVYLVYIGYVGVTAPPPIMGGRRR